ncbi:hypothetical protein P280DRAFT_477675 [Massarina eburnea CBS 473.64]|uniref:Uncharacterized protein n=1 Tax=Massarina eburnea CBS 473.64 TaxID=1395130 RepID=A0A6A6SBS5_9PLEO|nr:hypothetical protein P280DRAFT_477675 [Massarina eburnea CBS 473.64]
MPTRTRNTSGETGELASDSEAVASESGEAVEEEEEEEQDAASEAIASSSDEEPEPHRSLLTKLLARARAKSNRGIVVREAPLSLPVHQDNDYDVSPPASLLVSAPSPSPSPSLSLSHTPGPSSAAPPRSSSRLPPSKTIRNSFLHPLHHRVVVLFAGRGRFLPPLSPGTVPLRPRSSSDTTPWGAVRAK